MIFRTCYDIVFSICHNEELIMGLIRFFLAISVIIAHNGIRAPGIEGHLAVMSFFVISGFYMALVLNEKYQHNILGFYFARFLRLWPSYIIVFLIVLIFVAPMGNVIYQTKITAIYVWLSSLTMFFYQTLSWFGLDSSGNLVFLTVDNAKREIPALIDATHMQQMWSIGVEICFYILAPLFARKPKLLVVLLVISLMIFIAIKKFLYFHHPLDHRSAICFFWLFLMGMLSYFGWVIFKDLSFANGLKYLPLSLMGVLASITCIAVVWQYFSNPYVTMLCFGLFAVSIIPVFHASRKSKFDRAIGELSYPIYLIHWPIVAFIITGHRGSWLWSFLIIGISVSLSIVLHIIVDKNIERFRKKLVKNTV